MTSRTATVFTEWMTTRDVLQHDTIDGIAPHLSERLDERMKDFE
jgi:hypothetical protein